MAGETIFLVEFITAGGFYSEGDALEDIMIEGITMLRALIGDALKGGFRVHALVMDALDPALILENENITWHTIQENDDLIEKITEIGDAMDYSFVVAPEFGNHLLECTKALEKTKSTLLSPSSSVVEVASNKFASLQIIEADDVPVPKVEEVRRFIKNPLLDYPLVMKPIHGAGCAGVFMINDNKSLEDAIKREKALSFPLEELILQKYIQGTPCSASFIALKNRVILLGINEQFITLDERVDQDSKYTGGVANASYPELRQRCHGIGSIIAERLKLRGYFGFDFILDDTGDITVVEINPRLTTSFVGYEAISTWSLLQILSDGWREENSLFSGDCSSNHGVTYKISNGQDSKGENIPELDAGFKPIAKFTRRDGTTDLFMIKITPFSPENK